MGSILDALYAGWKLATTETIITVADTAKISDGLILAERINPECCAKLKVILEILRT